MAKKKNEGPGRPAGSPNSKSSVLRDEICGQFRCSQGYNKTVDALMATGQYKSKADIYHEALQLLALRKLQDPAAIFWLNKIM